MQHKRFILVCRSRETGELDLVDEHVTNMLGIISGTGEMGVLFGVFGNDTIWSREMIDEQYEILERLPAETFFARLGHQGSQAQEGE